MYARFYNILKSSDYLDQTYYSDQDKLEESQEEDQSSTTSVHSSDDRDHSYRFANLEEAFEFFKSLRFNSKRDYSALCDVLAQEAQSESDMQADDSKYDFISLCGNAVCDSASGPKQKAYLDGCFQITAVFLGLYGDREMFEKVSTWQSSSLKNVLPHLLLAAVMKDNEAMKDKLLNQLKSSNGDGSELSYKHICDLIAANLVLDFEMDRKCMHFFVMNELVSTNIQIVDFVGAECNFENFCHLQNTDYKFALGKNFGSLITAACTYRNHHLLENVIQSLSGNNDHLWHGLGAMIADLKQSQKAKTLYAISTELIQVLITKGKSNLVIQYISSMINSKNNGTGFLLNASNQEDTNASASSCQEYSTDPDDQPYHSYDSHRRKGSISDANVIRTSDTHSSAQKETDPQISLEKMIFPNDSYRQTILELLVKEKQYVLCENLLRISSKKSDSQIIYVDLLMRENALDQLPEVIKKLERPAIIELIGRLAEYHTLDWQTKVSSEDLSNVYKTLEGLVHPNQSPYKFVGSYDPLGLAISNRNLRLVDLLISLELDPIHQKSAGGHTVLYNALMKEQFDTIQRMKVSVPVSYIFEFMLIKPSVSIWIIGQKCSELFDSILNVINSFECVKSMASFVNSCSQSIHAWVCEPLIHTFGDHREKTEESDAFVEPSRGQGPGVDNVDNSHNGAGPNPQGNRSCL